MIKENSLQRETELSNCTFVKTILMILVVFYHAILFWKGNWFSESPSASSSVLPVLADWLNSFHIYAFTLVSGYLFAYLKFEKGKYDKFLPFVINKAKRLLVPYFFVAIAWAIPFAVIFFKASPKDIFVRFFLGTSPNQLWFLLMLFWCFLIFYLLSDFFREHDFLGVVVVIGIYAFSLIAGRFVNNYFMIWRACAYLPLFWLGVKIRQRGSDIIRRIPGFVYVIADVALFALVKYVLTGSSTIEKLLNLGCTFILHILGAVMAFVVLQKLADIIKWENSRIFKFTSQNSMPIYLFHQQLVYVSLYFLNGINPYIHVAINLVFAMSLSLFISFILMKFKSTKFLIGEK